MVRIEEYKEEFIDEYFKNVGAVVIANANSNLNDWSTYFPESVSQSVADESFFRDLLTMKIGEMCKNHSSIREYYNFAFFASLDAEKVFGKFKSDERKKIRKEYFEKYISNADYTNLFFSNANIKINRNYLETDGGFDLFQKKIRSELKRINEKLINSIDYKNIIETKHRVGIVENLPIKVCPYCNRQYIVKLNVETGKVIGDIDHFYPKYYFTLFALSLYNFVPSCKICNSLFKGGSNADIQYPYEMKEECNISFRLKNGDYEIPSIIYGWNDNLSIEAFGDSKESKEKAEREIDLFKLNAQYSIHSEYARNFLYKKNVVYGMNSSQYADFFKSIPGIPDEKIKEILLDYDIENMNISDKPLSKLIRDIYTNYSLLNI